MSWLFSGIADWLKQILTDAIMASFQGSFDYVNQKVQDVAAQVGQTPEGWNSGVFSMVKTLSETVVIPIAGIILTYVLCYELIQLITEKNNLHDFDSFVFFRWIFKTFVAVFILTNTWNIVMAVFDLGQHVVNASAGVITGSTDLGSPAMMDALRAQMSGMGIGELLGLYLESSLINICMFIMGIVIFIVVWGRMLEIYLTVSVAPIPFSTMVNREWGQMGNNYLRALFALAFQGFLIMVCVGIYSALVAGIAAAGDIHTELWTMAGMSALLCFILIKTGGMARSIFNAH